MRNIFVKNVIILQRFINIIAKYLIIFIGVKNKVFFTAKFIKFNLKNWIFLDNKKFFFSLRELLNLFIITLSSKKKCSTIIITKIKKKVILVIILAIESDKM